MFMGLLESLSEFSCGVSQKVLGRDSHPGQCEWTPLSGEEVWGPWLTVLPVFSDALAPSLRGYFSGLEVPTVLLKAV